MQNFGYLSAVVFTELTYDTMNIVLWLNMQIQ